MTIDRENLFKLYMEKVNRIVEECDWKTHFTPEEVVGLVVSTLEENPELIDDGNDILPAEEN